MQIGNLTVRLGVDADTFKVKDFVHAIGELPFSVASGITALTGMSFAVTDLFKDTLGLANNLTMFTSVTGQSADELQRWNLVAKGLGLNADSVQSSIENMVKTMAALKLGHVDEGFMVALGRLHVGMDMQHPFAMLRKATVSANAMKDKGVAAQLLGALGIDPHLISSGALSDRDLAHRGAAGVTLDNAQIKAMKDFQVSLAIFESTLETALVGPLAAATPVMAKLADALSDMIKIFGPLVTKGLSTGVDLEQSLSKGNYAKAFTEYMQLLPGSPFNVSGFKEARQMIMNVTHHIHSSGDAHAVADVVNQFTARYYRKAVSAFNSVVK